MALAQKLNLRQSQSLVMTPQLSQSIKLLAMSNIELSTFVEDEIERNPFLERDTRSDGQAEDLRNAAEAKTETPEPARELTENTDLETSAQAISENLGTSIENLYPDEQDYSKADNRAETAAKDQDFRLTPSGLSVSNGVSAYDKTVADFSANTLSLRDHLLEQLTMASIPPSLTMVAADLIDNLDTAGYLHTDLIETAKRLGSDHDEVRRALELVQGFEPTGIGARDLRECLCLQLREKNRLDPAMEVLINNLGLLAKRDYPQLARLTDLDADDLQDAIAEIRALDPKPGTAFESGPVQHVAPDVFVSEAIDGSWHIELNSETLPRVLINENYVAQVSGSMGGETEKAYMAECLQTASWLTKGLDQRAKTILKVAAEIVKKQDGFLINGVRYLKPLTLREVADEIDMHESSVSRVTSNKYMMTPRGLFELKYFFTTAIASSAGGEEHSSEAVRDQIKALIDTETAKTVLSDDAIVVALKASGIDIARRTIAKYRDAMDIPSSVQRRRELRAQQR